MVVSPSDSSRRRIIMSKYIPGNQKHLTLNDRICSKESLEQKIAKIEKAISKNREQYDRLTAEMDELHKGRFCHSLAIGRMRSVM